MAAGRRLVCFCRSSYSVDQALPYRGSHRRLRRLCGSERLVGRRLGPAYLVSAFVAITTISNNVNLRQKEIFKINFVVIANPFHYFLY